MYFLREYNPKWPQIPNFLYKIIIAGEEGIEKRGTKKQNIIDRIYLYKADLYKTKYQHIVNICKQTSCVNSPATFVEYLNDINDNYGLL